MLTAKGAVVFALQTQYMYNQNIGISSVRPGSITESQWGEGGGLDSGHTNEGARDYHL